MLKPPIYIHTDVPTYRRLQMYPHMYPHCRYTHPKLWGRPESRKLWRYIQSAKFGRVEVHEKSVGVNEELQFILNKHSKQSL